MNTNHRMFTTRRPARRGGAARSRASLLIVAVLVAGAVPLVASSPSNAEVDEIAVVGRITQPMYDGTNGNSPAPMIVDASRNLGFAIGRDDPSVSTNFLAVYDLEGGRRQVVGPAIGFGSQDIFRFAVDEAKRRLIGPVSFNANGAQNACADGSSLSVYDYNDSGTDIRRRLQSFKVPCSGAFEFVPFTASIYTTKDGSRKLLAAGSYRHEGWRAANDNLGVANNLAQALIVRQMDLDLLDDARPGDALDWEIDLRYAGCGRWDSYRVLAERLGDDVLSYCWDTKPVAKSLGAQGYVVRIPLDKHDRPRTTKDTPVLLDPTNPTPLVRPPTLPPAPRPQDWLGTPSGQLLRDTEEFVCPLPVPIPGNTPVIGGSCNTDHGPFLADPPPNPGVVDTDRAVEDTTGFAGDAADAVDPEGIVPPLGDPTNPTNSKFIANALVRRTPTFPGPVSAFVDQVSGRLLLLTADATNGNAVWIFDPRAERFIGLFTGGDPELDPLKTAAGFNPTNGRGYIFTSGGLLVGSVRRTKLSGRVFPAVGDFERDGVRWEQTVPAQSIAVAPAINRLVVPVTEREFIPPAPTAEPEELPRIERVVTLFAGLLGALRETPPNLTKAQQALDEFVRDDPLLAGARPCTQGSLVPGLGTLLTCVNELLDRLDEEPGMQTVQSCRDAFASAAGEDPPTVGGLAAAEAACNDSLLKYAQGAQGTRRTAERDDYYLVLEDRGTEAEETDADDPDRNTRQIDEEPGKTEADKAGAVKASGAHVLVTGGIPRVVNQLNQNCETPVKTIDDLPVNERDLYARRCLADQVISSGNREYHVAYVDTDTGSSTGSNAEASGFFIPLTERPTDEDIRNLGDCGAGTGTRLIAPASSQNQEFQDGVDDFFAGTKQACAPLQGGLSNVTDDDLRQGTHGGRYPVDEDGDGRPEPVPEDKKGKGFPVAAATCNDFGGKPATDSEPTGAKGAIFSAEVSCDAGAVVVAGEAAAHVVALPTALGQTVGVGRVWSDSRSSTTPDGQVTAVLSVAENVTVGPLAIGSIRTAAVTQAKGRNNTAQARFERVWCKIELQGVVIESGCTDPATDPQIVSMIDDLNQALGKVRISVPPANGKAGRGEATPGGFQAVVTKNSAVHATDQVVNDDDSITIPGMQVIVYNDGSEGRSRLVLQLAGVHAESRYGIVLLPDFSIPDVPELDFIDDPIVEALEVAAGAPPEYEIIEAIEAIPASVSSRNPLAEFFQAPFSSLRDLLGWMMQNWREAMLLFLLLSILSTPLYLFLRRRAFEQAMVS